jgi:hypothetical protein
MSHPTRRLLVMLSLLMMMLLATAVTASAHSSTPGSNHVQATRTPPRFAKESQACNHLLVTLHGSNLPTVQCQDKKTTTNGVSPNLTNGGCPGNLEVFSDAQDQGDDLCFVGTGNANLTDFCLPWYDGGCVNGTWNDIVSSYISHAHGCIYTDINEGGLAFEVYSNDGENLPGIWNDSITSIHVGDGLL